MRSNRSIISSLAAATLLLALAGCAAPHAEAAPTPTPSPTPTETARAIDGEITDAHICGQVSALSSLMYFAHWNLQNGKISDADDVVIRRAAAEGWHRVLTIRSEVSTAVINAQAKLTAIEAAGGDGYVATDTDLGRIGEAVSQACTNAGSQIAVMGAPGEG